MDNARPRVGEPSTHTTSAHGPPGSECRGFSRLAALALWSAQLGPEPHDNILRLVALAKELLAGSSVMYNSFPDEPPTESTLGGRICDEPLRHDTDDVFLVHNLQQSAFALTDPAVRQEGLQTYMGKAVRAGNQCMGALCIAYQHEFLPTDEDQQVLMLVATLIGIEESRRHAEDRLRHQQRLTQGVMQTMLSREDRIVELKQEVNALRSDLGLAAKYCGRTDKAVRTEG